MATHTVECIGDELKDTRLTLQDALSLRLFCQQVTTSQSAMIKGKDQLLKSSRLNCQDQVKRLLHLDCSGRNIAHYYKSCKSRYYHFPLYTLSWN